MPAYRRSKLTFILWGLAAAAVLAVGVLSRTPEKSIQRKIEHQRGVTDPHFKREMGVLLGPAILSGNRVTALQNGDEIFPVMLAAIRSARQSINFETYIYWSGSVGQEFADALVERARAGVEIHVLLDWAGSAKMERRLLEELQQAGIQVERYHPLRWYNINRLNNRTHRKLLIVDGQVGFTGGVGIGDLWLGHAQDADHWRDMHFRIEGPVVAQFQAAFMDNWIKTTGTVLHGDKYFPALAGVGNQDAHLFISSPAGGSDSMQLMYLMALAAAERSIDLEASYFIPDGLMSQAVITARGRGARVRVLVPGKHTDSEAVRLASKHEWGPLLEQGVEIREYEPTMLHCKLLVVDGEMVSVGSTNFDNRSFKLNDEASLNVYDPVFANQMTTVFEHDWSAGAPYSYGTWQRRPWTERLSEIIVRPIRSQL